MDRQIGKNKFSNILRNENFGIESESRRLELDARQTNFVGALNRVACLLDLQGFKRSSWMVIAGGGVFLYQLDALIGGRVNEIDRVPTDLDIIVEKRMHYCYADIIMRTAGG